MCPMCALWAAMNCSCASSPSACAAASLAPARAGDSAAWEVAPCAAGRVTDAVLTMPTRLTIGTWRVAADGQADAVRDAPATAHSAPPPTRIEIILLRALRGMRDRAN